MTKKGFIPRDFIDNLVARTDIVSIINMRVPLKKAGRDYKACCPFHDEKTPSFTVSETKQFYYCFGCGAKGTVINFIMDYERLEFVEAVEVIASHEGLDIPYEKNEQLNSAKEMRSKSILDCLAIASAFYRRQLRTHRDKLRAVEYLQNRGVTGDIAKRYAIGFAVDEWNALLQHLTEQGIPEEEQMEAGLLSESNQHRYDRFRDRIIFPIRNRRGDTIGFGGRILGEGEPKYLNSPETQVFHKGNEVYGLYELRKHERQYNEIIVVEGYMDVVMLAHYGIGNAVATLGTAISAKQIEMLLRYTSTLVFCFDGDRAGRGAANKAMEESLSVITAGKELSFLFLPDGEDPDTFVQKVGKEAFQKAIHTAMPFSKYLFESQKEAIDIKTIEGRSKLLESASFLINQMQDIPLRDLLREALAKEANIREGVLDKHVKRGRQERQKRNIRFHVNRSIPERILIIILNNIALVHQIHGIQFLLESDEREYQQLYQIISSLQDYSNIKSFAQVLIHFNEEPWIEWLQSLSMNDVMLEGNETQLDEINDLLKRLARVESPLKRVLTKLQHGEELSEEEKLILQQKK